MNNVRRKDINKIINTIEILKSQIENLLSEEEFSFDNMPEGIQESEKGDKSQEAIENLQSAIDSIDEAIDYLTDAKGV